MHGHWLIRTSALAHHPLSHVRTPCHLFHLCLTCLTAAPLPDVHAADYRALYEARDGEIRSRMAAARKRVESAYRVAQEEKDSRKAKVMQPRARQL